MYYTIVNQDNSILAINISHFISALNFLTCDDESRFTSNVGKFPDYFRLLKLKTHEGDFLQETLEYS